MDKIYKMLKKIEPCPGPYIGSQKIVDLQTFIFGYMYAISEENPFFKSEFYGLNDFVSAYYYGEFHAAGWRIIIEKETQEDEAIDEFYRFLDEFYIPSDYTNFFSNMNHTGDTVYMMLKSASKHHLSNSLFRLQSLAHGFIMRQTENNPNFKSKFFGFSGFVAQKYDGNPNDGWVKLIHDHLKDETQESAMFYDLLDAFYEVN